MILPSVVTFSVQETAWFFKQTIYDAKTLEAPSAADWAFGHLTFYCLTQQGLYFIVSPKKMLCPHPVRVPAERGETI